jgi:hypothetical protein
MAKYSDIKGFTVQTVSTDPVASAVAGGAWASGGNLPSVLYENAGAGATQSASMNFGGQGNSPSPQFPHTADTQTYDGSSWTEVNNLNNSRRYLSGAGVITSALGYGGYTVPPSAPGTKDLCESWDGTNWTEVAELNTKRREVAGIGTSNSNALCVQGTDGTSVTSEVESWNGSSWTEVAEANTLRFRSANTGSNTASIIVGGEVPSTADSALVESWNGSAWTEIADINTARQQFSAAGTYTDALVMGGSPNLANTEYYDGSSWSEQADLSLGRYINYGSSGDTVAQGMVFGGNAPAPAGHRTNSTEEWSQPSVFSKQIEGQLFFNSTANAFKETISDIPNGVWSSGGNVNEARELLAGWGTNNNLAGVAGGNNGSDVAQSDTELYNGTSWTEVNEINSARATLGGCGLYAAALIAGAYPSTHYDKVEQWNGTSWTEKNELNTGRGYVGLSGTSTASLLVGGYSNPPTVRYANVEQWDGSSWTEIADLNSNRPGVGTAAGAPVTDTVVFGGYYPSSPTNITEKWDGTSWTEVGDMNNPKNLTTGHGDSGSNAGAFGASQPSAGAHNEIWNGASWTEVANTANAGWRQQGGTPDMSSGICSAGGPPAFAFVEEWNAPLVNKTVTAS